MPPPASPSIQPARILALGSINADFQVRVERRPEISETLPARDFRRLSGGKSANVAFIARRLGVDAQLFAHVGDDALAQQALQPLQDMGVDLRAIRRVPGASTGVAMITVPPDGKKGIVMAANANAAWEEADGDRIARSLRQAPPGSVLVANCEIPGFIVESAMRLARERGIPTVLDPSPAGQLTPALLALSDVLVPNAGEAHTLTGIAVKDARTAGAAGQRLRERGVGAACVKLPAGGCVLVAQEQTVHFPALPVPVVDTTGAGDAFAGALAVALLEQRPLPAAVRFAVAASHLAVGAYGSQPAYPTREAINAFETRLQQSVTDDGRG